MVDSTGYSTKKYEPWIDVRMGKSGKRKEFKKSHIIAGYWFKGILSHEITPGHKHDSPVFQTLMEKLPEGNYENISGDTAYCSRNNCNTAADKSIKPFFKPRKDVTSKARRSKAWNEMIMLWKNDRKLFDEEYHRRGIVESIIGAKKQRLGHTLFSKKDELQKKEVRLKVICYNLLVLNKVRASLIINEPPLLPVEKAG